MARMALPAMEVAGAETRKWVSAPALTKIGPLVPVMPGATVSVADNVWVPAVLKVMLKTPWPAVKVALAGRMAWLSLEPM